VSRQSGGAARAVERRIGLTVSGVLVVVVAVGGWVGARFIGGRSVYLLAYAGLILLGVSVYIARGRRAITAERSAIARRCRVGQTLDVAITLSSNRRVTTFRIEERLHPHLGTTVVVPVPVIVPGEPLVHHYSLYPRLRGVYQVGPMSAEFSDPLGLARHQQVLLKETEIIVHPTVEEVLDRPLTRAFEDPPLRPPKTRAWPQGFEFYGMRDYVRGDDLRRVVWRAFARTERLLVREFEQGISDRIDVVVDTDRNWHSPGNPSETFETAVRVAASVGARHVKDGFTVRLESNYAGLGVFRGPSALLTYLDELARIRLDKEPLGSALERLLRNGRRDSHVVLVTSNFDAESAVRANLLVNGGASLTVAAIVWDESDLTMLRRAGEVGAQVVQVKPGAPLAGVFRASLQTNLRVR